MAEFADFVQLKRARYGLGGPTKSRKALTAAPTLHFLSSACLQPPLVPSLGSVVANGYRRLSFDEGIVLFLAACRHSRSWA
jgi:hypothetical protein